MDQSNLNMVAEVQLSYKPLIKPSQRLKINTSLEAYEMLRDRWNTETIDFVEEFKIILLNRASRVLGVVPISSGGITGTACDPKLVFAAALKAVASSIMLAHNHPSGNLKPSQADISLTHKIQSAGGFLDIVVLDHLIISSDGYYSFADEGLL